VRRPPACENVSPGTEERPLLEDVTKQLSEDRDCGLRVIVICDVQPRAA
jgi:hypothetical protein